MLVYCTAGLDNYQILQTPQAKEKPNDLWCYHCDTMENKACENITTITNHSSLHRKCLDEELSCMVQRFSYTWSTENITSGFKIWSIQRKCSKKCESSCIVIGERVKLYACTSCCNTSLCNTGNKGVRANSNLTWIHLVLLTLFLAGCQNVFKFNLRF